MLFRSSDYLLVNAGQWKGADGVVGRPNLFTTASWSTNTLFFDDFGEYLYAGGQYVGGQMSTFPDVNLILNYETTTNYTYIKADHTNAYDKRADSRNPVTRSVRHFYRNFVYLAPNQFVVFDRIQALKDIYVKKLYWHLNKQGQPVAIDSKTTSSTVGSSRLFIKSVYPATSSVSFAQDLNSKQEAITPRVEIADTITSFDFNPLTVFVTDSNAASTPLITGIDASNMVGTMIGNFSPRMVLFAKDGTQQSSVLYSAVYSGAGNHLLVDMQPGSYTVLKDGSLIGTVTASAEGTLYFTAADGGSFSVVRQ